MKHKKNEIMINVLLMLFAILLMLSVSELAFRLVSHRLVGSWCGEDDLQCYLDKGEDIFANNLSENEALRPGQDIFRIAVLGDSFAYGWGSEDGIPLRNDAFPYRLEDILNSEFDSTDYEVMNFGFPAVGALEESLFLKEFVLEYHPDLVILQVTANDVRFNVYGLDPVKHCGLNPSKANSPIKSSLRHIKIFGYIYDRLSAKSHLGAFNPDNPASVDYDCFNASIGRMQSTLSERGIPLLVVLVQDEFIKKNGELYLDPDVASLFNRTFSSHGIDYIDTGPLILKRLNQVLSDDGYHYNNEGNLLIAKLIFNHLVDNEMLPSCKDEDCAIARP